MKKLIMVVLILMLVTPCFADINTQTTQTKAIEILRSAKSKADNISSRLTSFRQSIENMLADEASNLESTDQTKLNALVTEIQDIIDAADDLETKIGTHYPEV